MVEVVIVVREFGRKKPDYSLKFELPTLPRPGDYISINRPDHQQPYSEDMIVRHVWWRMHHADTRMYGTDADPEIIGGLTEITVECDIAIGPYATDHWRKYYGSAERFDVARFSVTEGELAEIGKKKES